MSVLWMLDWTSGCVQTKKSSSATLVLARGHRTASIFGV